MKQFRAYVGSESGQVTCINDAYGPSVAVFNYFYRPGEIASRNVGHKKSNYELTEARFRILREVNAKEIKRLAKLANCTTPLRDGWWYEVIGD